MEVQCYQNLDPRNKMNKTPTLLATVEMKHTANTSIKNPTFQFRSELPPEANYFYIPRYHRWYFGKAPVPLANGLWSVEMKSDVLTTARESVSNLTCILERQEFVNNLYQEDSMIGTYADTFTVCKIIKVGNSAKYFGIPVTGENVVLICT